MLARPRSGLMENARATRTMARVDTGTRYGRCGRSPPPSSLWPGMGRRFAVDVSPAASDRTLTSDRKAPPFALGLAVGLTSSSYRWKRGKAGLVAERC